MSSEIPDEVEWAKAAQGDGEAFGRIFDRHHDRVRRHSLRLVSIEADADDVVAVTFLEAWRRRNNVRLVNGSMLPWLLVTATNTAHNLSRSAGRYRALLSRLPPEQHTADHADALDEGDAHEALRLLSLADQKIIALCVIEGLSTSDAADVLDVPPGTVKSRLSRAKARLAHNLTSHQSSLRSQEAPHGF